MQTCCQTQHHFRVDLMCLYNIRKVKPLIKKSFKNIFQFK